MLGIHIVISHLTQFPYSSSSVRFFWPHPDPRTMGPTPILCVWLVCSGNLQLKTVGNNSGLVRTRGCWILKHVNGLRPRLCPVITKGFHAGFRSTGGFISILFVIKRLQMERWDSFMWLTRLRRNSRQKMSAFNPIMHYQIKMSK